MDNQPINILDRQNGRPGAPPEDRYATVETDVGLDDPPQQGPDEFVDALARGIRQVRQSRLERSVHGDGGGWRGCHPPDLRPSSHGSPTSL